MWTNNANCDIYIGKGVGVKLLKDIRAAKKSVKMYLLTYLLNSLKSLLTSKKEMLEFKVLTQQSAINF